MNRIFPLLLLTLLTPRASAQSEFRQSVERQAVVEQGAAASIPEQSNVVADDVFEQGPAPMWIWGNDNDQRYRLRQSFSLKSAVRGRLKASCDNSVTLFLNGEQVGSSTEWQEPLDLDVTRFLMDGENHLEARVANAGGIAAFVLHLVVEDVSRTVQHVVSDESWSVAPESAPAQSGSPEIRGQLGDGPWGNVFANSTPGGRVPRGVFEIAAGFHVDKLFTVPKDELGSWVCIAFDGKGRLLASDQGDKGLCRITLPGIPSTNEGDSATTKAETIVERLDFSQCEIQPTSAQGMLWAFDSLYLSINGGPGSGLYRARDTDGDDVFDECVRLKALRGGGEHGPHALRLSPDGKRIYLICGNHTDPPFTPGEEQQHTDYTSRIRTNWGEDLLLPRMWDANGHARGKLAPGGWIASTDPDGKSWDVFSIGYRNPYDMAFNADGELFAYDADMEWDVGLPWYRPTRVVHATSGSEFGWRSGSGKWPAYYVDSLPPMVNIGPGSPVGVEFGYGLKFPEEYQRALFICDWTFGTMYSIHLLPFGSSYHATRREFLSRSPLPLTDVAAGPDGALYFTIGGRGTQSELFRVTARTTAEALPVAALADSLFAEKRRMRKELEASHGDRPTEQQFLAAAAATASDDRVLSYAATVLATQGSVAQLQRQIAAVTQSNHMTAVQLRQTFALLRALCRASDATRGLPIPADQQQGDPQSLRVAEDVFLNHVPSVLDSEQLLDYLRTLSLVTIRLGELSEETRKELLQGLTPLFPNTDPRVSRELCQMLVHLKSPDVVPRTIALLMEPAEPTVPDGLEDLISRNPGYGRAFAAMLKNAPDQQQIWYAYCLRCAEVGWTLEAKAEYFRWCSRARNWAGGNSYRKFIQNMDDELWSATRENERVLLEAMEARTPFRLPELPRPEGPGKAWTLDEIRQLAQTKLTGRDFENGQKMFAATRCVLCHRFAGDGGATGPDLTQLAGRFNLNDLTEAIMNPGKVISDQYKASTVVTTDGRTIAGRIISENAQQISVLTDPEDSTKIIDVPRSAIEEILPSTVSLMPQDLLKPLNEDEVLDLLAYLLSRGNERDAMFRR